MFVPCASLPRSAVLTASIAISAVAASTTALAHDASPTAAMPNGWAYRFLAAPDMTAGKFRRPILSKDRRATS